MTKGELFYLLRDVPDDFPVLMETSDGSVCDIALDTITESCEDQTVVGYIIIPKEVKH